MALRLRRGTDAERQLITPLEGELIYATDTKSLYVGDGSTLGGILIAASGEVSNTVAGLLDTDIAGLQDGDVLVYNSLTNEWNNRQSALELDDLTDLSVSNSENFDIISYDGLNWKNIRIDSLANKINSLTTIDDIAGVVLDNPKNFDIMYYDGTAWANTPATALTDRILSQEQTHTLTIAGNDSTIIVDPVTNRHRGDFYGSLYDGLGNLMIDEFTKAAMVDVRDPTDTYTVLDNFTGDLRRGENGQLIIQGGENPTFLGSVDGPIRGTVVGPDLNVILNHDTGTLYGDVVGSVFADDSTVIIDGQTGNIGTPQLTADIINAGLVTASLTDPFSGEVKDIEFISSENADVGVRIFRQAQVADATQTDIGTIFFDTVDKNAGDFQSTGSYITSTAQQNGTDPYLKTKISMGTIDGAGNPTSANNFTITWDGNFGVGTDDPSAKLDVQGAIKPGVYADAAARDAAIPSPVAGMMVFVTDVAQFQGNTDGTLGGWVNLN